MKSIKTYVNESWLDDIFTKQDNFKKKMIKEWKSNKKLKAFDKYFQWKTKEISVSDISKDDIKEMRKNAHDMLDELWEKNNEDELIRIIEVVDLELINLLIIKK